MKLINRNKSFVEISKKNLYWNIKQIRKKIGPGVKFLAVVKANAYGHGIKEISLLVKDRVDFFGVDNIDEALFVRSLGIKKPILVLGFLQPERYKEAADKDISISFYNKEFLNDIKNISFKEPLKVHLKIETGMHRQGIELTDLNDFCIGIKKYPSKLVVEGVYSHFSEAGDVDFTKLQFRRIEEAVKILDDNGFENVIKHISASSGTLNGKKYHLDMVRSGICLYGYLPYSKPETSKDLDVRPVLAWKSIVAQVKTLEVGDFVGYGRTWRAKEKTKIAVIPVGYYDGFDRRFSNNGAVFIKWKSAKIVGRIAMNMFTVDVTKIKNVQIGDEIVILKDADVLAEKIGTINHEILSRINPLIPRVVV